MGDDAELEAIRRKRVEELQRQQQTAVQQEAAKQQMDQQKQTVMRQILTPEARDRLARLKTARPEFVEQVEAQLIMLVQSGQIREKISDEILVQILEKLTPEKKEIKITRR